jgi:dTDP-4-amino-4,6-dideoxygalactose transaminase
VSSCTAAIELALRSFDLPPGSPVLTSTMTFCGAVQAIVHAGLELVGAVLGPGHVS